MAATTDTDSMSVDDDVINVDAKDAVDDTGADGTQSAPESREDESGKLPDRVLVFCRIRPEVAAGADAVPVAGGSKDSSPAKDDVIDTPATMSLKVDELANQVTVPSKPNKPYTFDSVLGQRSSQDDVYRRVAKPVLESALNGAHGCIMAYGTTGSGKTHSLLNTGDGKGVGGAGGSAGIVPRLSAELFSRIGADLRHTYQVKVAMFQVYNESIDDLLKSRQGLALVGSQVKNLEWFDVRGPAQLLSTFHNGRRRLAYAETHMNKRSSRSHCILQLKILRRQRAPVTTMDPTRNPQGSDEADADDRMSCGDAGAVGAKVKVEQAEGCITICDLAGSERQKKSGSTGARLIEASNINTSNLVLGKVVAALAQRKKFIPYRDSVLTRILEPALSGKSRTVMLVCIAPEAAHASETTLSLEHASRAMAIPSKAMETRMMVEMSLDELSSTLAEGFSTDASRRAAAQIEAADARARAAEKQAMEEAERRIEAAKAAAEATALAEARLEDLKAAMQRSNEQAAAAVTAGQQAADAASRLADCERRAKEAYRDIQLQKGEVEREASKREEALMEKLRDLDKRVRAAEAESAMARAQAQAEERSFVREKEELEKALGIAERGAGSIVEAAEAAAGRMNELERRYTEAVGETAAARAALEAADSANASLRAEISAIRNDADADIASLKDALVSSGIVISKRSRRRGHLLSRVIRYDREARRLEWMPVNVKKKNTMELEKDWTEESDGTWMRVIGKERSLDVNVETETVRHFFAAIKHQSRDGAHD